MRTPPPDFVIVGAPKCGTTSLYATLKRHPQIFLSPAKEPHFFARDYPNRRDMQDVRDYNRLFVRAKPFQLRGEASVLYLSSQTAIADILQVRPDAKCIVLVRDPVQMYVSWHNECMKSLDEDETDLEKAWMLQEQRAMGKRIPRLCKEPGFLQY